MDEVLDSISKKSEDSFNRLYSSVWTSIALSRMLPPLAHQYVMRLVFVEPPVPVEFIQSWSRDEKAHNASIDMLLKLKMFKRIQKQGTECFDIHPAYQQSLRRAHLKRDETPFDVQKEKDVNTVTVDDLKTFAHERWDDVLEILVEEGKKTEMNSSVFDLLVAAGLLSNSKGITNAGFQFLLKDVRSQVWSLILSLIKLYTSDVRIQDEYLNCILQLSFCSLGQCYKIKSVSENQVNFLFRLVQLGFVYIRHETSKGFYPTHFLLGLSNRRPLEVGGESGIGHIIVETNFRVYAYTISNIQERIMALFCELNSRLPNLLVATMTRHSIHNALVKGITAEQIIRFLELHAHEHSPVPIVPEAIDHQLKLWEKERSRISSQEAELYYAFPNIEFFNKLVQETKRSRIYVYSCDKPTPVLFVAPDSSDIMRSLIEKIRGNIIAAASATAF